jgi:flagellar biosynthesis protein FlhB
VKLILYIKLQYKLLLGTSTALLVPLILHHKLLNSPIPNFHFFLLTILIVLKLVVFKESSYHQKALKIAKAQLTREMKKSPSRPLIHQRTQDLANSRDAALVLVGLAIIIFKIIS